MTTIHTIIFQHPATLWNFTDKQIEMLEAVFCAAIISLTGVKDI
jgi:hypothetical protein